MNENIIFMFKVLSFMCPYLPSIPSIPCLHISPFITHVPSSPLSPYISLSPLSPLNPLLDLFIKILFKLGSIKFLADKTTLGSYHLT